MRRLQWMWLLWKLFFFWFFFFTLFLLSSSSLLACFWRQDHFHSNQLWPSMHINTVMLLPWCLTSVAYRITKPLCWAIKRVSRWGLESRICSCASALKSSFQSWWYTRYPQSLVPDLLGKSSKKNPFPSDAGHWRDCFCLCGMRPSLWLLWSWQQSELCPWVNLVDALHCFFLRFAHRIILSVQKPTASWVLFLSAQFLSCEALSICVLFFFPQRGGSGSVSWGHRQSQVQSQPPHGHQRASLQEAEAGGRR